MEKLTPTEQNTLREFRKSVDDILKPEHDDAFLLRWLRARNFKLADAEAMLRKSMAWREKCKINDLLKTYEMPEVLKLYWSLGLIGHDKRGNPLWLIRYGNIDIKGILYSAKKSDVVMFYAYMLEKSEFEMKQQTKKLGRLIDKHTYIFDMENFTLQQIVWKPAFDLLGSIITFYEDNYPERLQRVFIINAPAIFQIGFALLKPFFSEATFGKIHIFGKDNWKNAVLEEIDEADLPVHWGGTKTGPNGDPFCTNLAVPGGPVPKSYYLQESQSFSNENDVETLEIGVKSVSKIEVFIPEECSILQWEFKTEKHDIAFGVFYKQDEYNDNDLIELVPIGRVNCHLVPETGTHVCEEEGTYVLVFDNSFSHFTSKTVRYRTDVIPPTTKL